MNKSCIKSLPGGLTLYTRRAYNEGIGAMPYEAPISMNGQNYDLRFRCEEGHVLGQSLPEPSPILANRVTRKNSYKR